MTSPLAVHFSSKTDLHSTPQAFFDKLNEEFQFDLDVCATAENAKCEMFYQYGKHDGLTAPWFDHGDVAWCNSPYGREIGKWVKKAVEEWKKGMTVVCLLPARTDTAWFQDFVLPYAELRWVRGRLKFGSAKNSAPFPSVVAVYRGER